MTATLTRDQMDAARAAILSRVISRLSYRRYVATLPGIDDHRVRDRDADMREIVGTMLDACPDMLARALDALDKHPGADAFDHATQARFVLARIAND
jgi:hypothetical protein